MNLKRWGTVPCAIAVLILAVVASGCVHVRNSIHNTLADAMDIVRADVSLSSGTDMGAHVMATEYIQLKSYSYENLHRTGLATRLIGTWEEEREDWWLGTWRAKDIRIRPRAVRGLEALLPPKLREGPDAAFARWGESPDEIGIGVHAFIAGLRVGLRPLELVDFLAGPFGLDLCDDNLTWEERQALSEADRKKGKQGKPGRRPRPPDRSQGRRDARGNMSNHTAYAITPKDRRVLRKLGKRVAEIAHDPVMEERRRLWTKQGDLQGERPMILAETGGVLDELLPVSSLECTGDWPRGLERGLRNTVFTYEQVGDDSIVQPCVNCNWLVSIGDYGVVPRRHTTEGQKRTSYRWDPAIKDLRKEFGKLHPRPLTVDREGTVRWKAMLEEVFDGVLAVRLRGSFWWTLGLTWRAVDLVGLDGLMMLMYDDPAALHRLMAFLRDDHVALVQWCEREGLFTLNNENDYVGSGALGYTTHLPRPDWREGDSVRARDTWMLSESQETVGVSPRMFAEFIFPYQLPLIERFGLCYYGCCEPVHTRWETLKTIPNLRRVSVAPWCDQESMAEALGRDYIFCRKPNPTLISTERFDEDLIRRDLRRTLEVAGECHLEIVMKDVHTVADRPGRLGRWVQIAREVCEEARNA